VKGHNPLAALNRALQGDTILVPDEELSIPGGHSRWISTRKCPLRNAQGEITGVIVTLQDITDRKRAEGRLQEYERVVEGLEEMIVVVDREYRYVIANRAFLKYRDMEREQILGHTVADVIGKRVFEMVIKEKMDECFRAESCNTNWSTSIPKLGNRDLFASIFRSRAPRASSESRLFWQDVTQRKQAEEALRRSEENYRLFVSQSSEGIFGKKWILLFPLTFRRTNWFIASCTSPISPNATTPWRRCTV